MTRVKTPGAGICYTKGGHWKPTIPGCKCQHCNVTFTAHSASQKFCSKRCAGLSRRGARVPHIERLCPTCDKSWSAPKSNPSRYCSKACMYEGMGWSAWEEKCCPQCGMNFRARWQKDKGKLQTYCSKTCASEASKTSIVRKCKNCGSDFSIHPSRNDQTCSLQCRTDYYKRDRSHGWKGGKVLQGDRLYRRMDRDGYAAKYEGEHRLIVAREIGRALNRGEVVICIDGDNDNVSPDNLFLCPNQKEFGFLKSGTVEWPSSSNLQDYRAGGYTRPNVIITLHDWENGKRRESERGKPITRHPQADEIIKRRKAGATARELAIEFSTNLSSMANILKRRL